MSLNGTHCCSGLRNSSDLGQATNSPSGASARVRTGPSSQTLVSARTIEALGINVDDSSSRVTISEKLVCPVVRLESIGIATATVNALDVVVWGRPLIQAEIRANEKDRLYQLGNGMPGDSPPSAITSVIECHGVLGVDFLRNFKLSLDFRTDTMVLEE